jgi:hypothetical protein
MSIAGISSFLSQNVANIQNQQAKIGQDFQSLAQQLQASNLSPSQTTALNPGLQSGPTPPLQGVPQQPIQSPIHGGHVHSNHHLRDPIEGDPSGDDSDTPITSPFGEFGQAVPSTSASAAQQAYSSLQQNLSQVALNSDLINAQSEALEDHGLSLTV